MLIDARALQDDFLLETDLCIVGSGAAGIPLALAFKNSGISTLLLEAGGFKRTAEDQELYAGEYAGNVPSVTDAYLWASRLRYFGGTTNHWGGFCRPLEAIDFEERDWVPHSGWPFSRKHLDPYYRGASKFLKIGDFDLENPDRDNKQLPDAFSDDLFQGKVYRFQPFRFAAVYGREFARSRELRLVHNANVVEIVTDEAESHVEALRIRTLSGIRGKVKAKVFVLATGAIENARLMLASGGSSSPGVGNAHDLVGRYFMEHPVTHFGMGPMFIRPEVSAELYQQREVGKEYRAQVLYLRDAQLRAHRMLTIGSILQKSSPEDLFAVELSEFDRAIMRATFDSDRLGQPLGAYVEPQILHTLNMCEPEPNPESRVTLTDSLDALGVPKVRVAWNLTGAELETIYEFVELLRRRISAAGWGRIKNPSEPQVLLRAMSKGFHHIGTTRMHEDPKRGVVDSQCRVHGIDNLFIAGSSVFPTAGAANPTFTIIALTLRLEDHLKVRFGVA